MSNIDCYFWTVGNIKSGDDVSGGTILYFGHGSVEAKSNLKEHFYGLCHLETGCIYRKSLSYPIRWVSDNDHSTGRRKFSKINI